MTSKKKSEHNREAKKEATEHVAAAQQNASPLPAKRPSLQAQQKQ